MISRVAFAVAAVALAVGALRLFVPGHPRASDDSQIVEEWVNANHLRLYIHGRWEDVPMTPLADHLCQSGNPFFERYCDPHSVGHRE